MSNKCQIKTKVESLSKNENVRAFLKLIGVDLSKNTDQMKLGKFLASYMSEGNYNKFILNQNNNDVATKDDIINNNTSEESDVNKLFETKSVQDEVVNEQASQELNKAEDKKVIENEERKEEPRRQDDERIEDRNDNEVAEPEVAISEEIREDDEEVIVSQEPQPTSGSKDTSDDLNIDDIELYSPESTESFIEVTNENKDDIEKIKDEIRNSASEFVEKSKNRETYSYDDLKQMSEDDLDKIIQDELNIIVESEKILSAGVKYKQYQYILITQLKYIQYMILK